MSLTAGWLTDARASSETGRAFVLATVWSKSGYSPDTVGARLIVTDKTVAGTLNSDHRRNTIARRARGLLDGSCSGAIDSYPLGEILGSQNGTYEVQYCVFRQHQAAMQWLDEACDLQQRGIRFVLAQSIDLQTPGNQTTWQIITPHTTATDPLSQLGSQMLQCNLPPESTDSMNGEHTMSLLQVIGEPLIPVCIVGTGRVTESLAEQLRLLPVSVLQIHTGDQSAHRTQPPTAHLQDFAPELLPNRTRLVIATGHHETDYQYCEQALRSTNIEYVGCIGSDKKAALIKARLRQSSIPPQRIDHLHVPIGWSAISGKHPSIVAASIVAQLLSLRTQ
ncbi:MAG: XdhC/CoxI family protein [Pseudomonadota bacterium]